MQNHTKIMQKHTKIAYIPRSGGVLCKCFRILSKCFQKMVKCLWNLLKNTPKQPKMPLFCPFLGHFWPKFAYMGGKGGFFPEFWQFASNLDDILTIWTTFLSKSCQNTSFLTKFTPKIQIWGKWVQIGRKSTKYCTK